VDLYRKLVQTMTGVVDTTYPAAMLATPIGPLSTTSSPAPRR